MSTPSKKRTVIRLEVKKKIIEAAEGHTSEELGNQFGLPASSIRNILRVKVAIIKAVEEGGKAKRSRLQAVKHKNMEKAVLQWFKDQRSTNTPMTRPILMKKAKKLANELAKQMRKVGPLNEDQDTKADELESFKASDGWLSGFKYRHSIVFKKNQREAAEINMEALGDWQQDVLHEELSHFSADDVFNADETGLFWQLLPNNTLAFKR